MALLPEAPTSSNQASESQTPSNAEKTLSTRCREMVFGNRSTSNDLINDLLDDIAASANRHVAEWTVTQLRNFYHSKGSSFDVPQPLIDEVWIFRDSTEHATVKNHMERYHMDAETRFPEFALSLLDLMSTGQQAGFRLVAIVDHMSVGLQDLTFSLSEYYLNTRWRYRDRDIKTRARWFARLIIAHSLKIHADNVIDPFPSRLPRLRGLLRVPSQSYPQDRLDIHDVSKEFIGLDWLGHAPRFKSDYSVYISEPHKWLPGPRRASVRLNLSAAPTTGDLMVVFSHTSSLQVFTKARSDLYLNSTKSANSTQIWTCQSEAVFSLIATLQVVIIESTDFVNDLTATINQMKFYLRRSPSTSKIRFLMHVEDCRVAAYAGLCHASQVCDRIGSWITSQQDSGTWWDGGEAFIDRFSVIQKDLKFLQESVREKETECNDLRTLLHEHVNLVQNRRIFLTTIIAGLYIPLSFTTSLFGMNMNPFSDVSQRRLEHAMTMQIESLPADLKNSTMALVSAITSSGNLSYDWKTFTITATCLVMTLPFAVLIDSIVRHSVRWAPILSVMIAIVVVFTCVFTIEVTRQK